MKIFGSWPIEIHDSTDQETRISSAQKAAVTPSSVDTATQAGILPGSGKAPYQTSLTGCSCADFKRRKLPCKHMYRLAMELGIIDGPFSSGVNKNKEFSLEEAVALLENLPDACQMYIMHSINGPENQLVDCSGDLAMLKESPLASLLTPSVSQLISSKKKAEIIDLLHHHSIEPPQKLLKAELISWCQENTPELVQDFPEIYVFSFSPRFQKAQRNACYYLKRKYDWEYYYGGGIEYRYPWGSERGSLTFSIGYSDVSCDDDSKYHFPSDKITDLLNFYDHNRCADGFTPEPAPEE